MSTVSIIVIVVLAYIVQVLLLLSYPYYKYRQSCKNNQERTIGGLIEFINCSLGEEYVFSVFFPIVGFASFILMALMSLIVVGIETFYKFIKDIKI